MKGPHARSKSENLIVFWPCACVSSCDSVSISIRWQESQVYTMRKVFQNRTHTYYLDVCTVSLLGISCAHHVYTHVWFWPTLTVHTMYIHTCMVLDNPYCTHHVHVHTCMILANPYCTHHVHTHMYGSGQPLLYTPSTHTHTCMVLANPHCVRTP